MHIIVISDIAKFFISAIPQMLKQLKSLLGLLVVSFPDPQQDGDRTSLLVNIDLNRQAEGGAIKIISKSATEQPTGIHIPFPLLPCGKSLGMKLAHRGWEFGSTDIILCI